MSQVKSNIQERFFFFLFLINKVFKCLSNNLVEPFNSFYSLASSYLSFKCDDFISSHRDVDSPHSSHHAARYSTRSSLSQITQPCKGELASAPLQNHTVNNKAPRSMIIPIHLHKPVRDYLLTSVPHCDLGRSGLFRHFLAL